jgi:hypothetical protein
VDDVVDRLVELQVVARARAARIEPARAEDLELDRVGARPRGELDQAQSQLEAALLFRAGLVDDESRVPVSDGALSDPHVHLLPRAF